MNPFIEDCIAQKEPLEVVCQKWWVFFIFIQMLLLLPISKSKWINNACMWLLYHHVKFIFSFVLFSQVLRLICLQCIVNSGFKPKVLEQYKREIIHTYGFEHFLTLENLEKAGLLHVQQGRSTYATIRKTMQLTVDDVSEHDPTDMSYVHSGWVVFKIQNWSYPTIGNFISNYCEFGKTSKNVWVKIGGKVRDHTSKWHSDNSYYLFPGMLL